MEVAAACVAGTAGLAAVYRVARPYFSVRVNCHFCNNNYKVRHEEANSWVCPGCGQYNGWTEDGDYNRDLGLDTEDGGHSHNTGHNNSSNNNGLCRGCNLNQELKVAALARCEYEGEELDEHRAHLEAAYRLCPQCEATLQSRLAEQDRSLAPAVLQWRLETSREASRRLPAPAPASAPHLHLLLALVTLVTQWPGLALWLQHTKLPAWLELQLEAALFPHLSPAEAAAQLLPSLAPALLLVAVVTSLASRHLALASCHLMNLLLILSSQPPAAQLVCSCLAVLTAAVTTSGPRRNEKKERKSPGPVLTSTPVPPPDTASVLTQDLLSSASSLATPPPAAPPPPLSTAAPPRPCMVTSPELSPLSPGAVSGLLRSSSEQSFNHEFASVTGSPRPEDRDCDLASLSLGSQLTSTPRQSPFPIGRCYSPVPAPDTCSLFSPRARSRPLLAPSRLTSTSWVAGGYWGGPGSTLGPATVSRASSISSGFVSGRGSLASTALGSHYPSSQLGPGFRRRTVDESISDSDTPHPSQAPPSPPPSPAPAVSAAPPLAKAPGWTITVRVTPTDLLLAASVCVNVGLAILWLSSG